MLGSASGVHDAGVWAGTVTVDLVKGHHDHTTLGDLGHGVAVVGHDGLDTGVDVAVVTRSKSLTAGGLVVTSEAGGVLLERVAVGAITRSGGVNCANYEL